MNKNKYDKIAEEFLDSVYGNVPYTDGLLKSLSQLLENLSSEIVERTKADLVEHNYFEPYNYGCG